MSTTKSSTWHRRGVRTWSIRLLFFLMVALVISTIWCVVSSVQSSLDGSSSFSAYVRVIDDLTNFVRAKKKWPRDWDELYAGKSDYSVLHRRVEIDFSRSILQLAESSLEELDVVRIRTPPGTRYIEMEEKIWWAIGDAALDIELDSLRKNTRSRPVVSE